MNENYKEYKILDSEIDRLFEEKRFKEAINKLEESYEKFPQYDFELKVYAIYCCRENGDYEKCMQLLNEGLNKGYFYGLSWEGWNPLKEFDQWKEILIRNESNRQIVQENSKMQYRVHTPENYDENTAYPLFISLHGDGNGCNIEDFSNEWKPDPLLEMGFVTAYVQSSHAECTGGFGWTSDYKKSREEIREAYDHICLSYSIDQDKVIIGGFSGGSMASLNMMMNNAIPMKGIVALCPNATEDCTDENIQKAAARGEKIVLLEGEKSGEVPFHKELLQSAEKYGMDAQYIINKNAGHVVPADFDKTIVKAADFILRN
jgi:predicted esterase